MAIDDTVGGMGVGRDEVGAGGRVDGQSVAASGTKALWGAPGEVRGGPGGGGGGSGGNGSGGVVFDPGMLAFVRGVSALWKKLEASSIEKINVGQQEALGVRDLLKLSNEQVDQIAVELKRIAAQAKNGGEVSTLLYDLMMDSASCRKRLNDYTEGLLVQTAQRLDVFAAAFKQSRGAQS